MGWECQMEKWKESELCMTSLSLATLQLPYLRLVV